MQHIRPGGGVLNSIHTGRMAARDETPRGRTMTISHTIANCFMGLVAFMALAAQVGMVTGMIGPV